MRHLLLAATATACLSAAPALAADLPGVVETEMPAPAEATGWDGFYATVYGAYVFGPQITPSWGTGVSLGVDARSGSMVYGATASVGRFFSGTLAGDYVLQLVGRAGYLVTDNALLFGLAGVGWETENNAPYIPLGVGAEFALNDAFSIRLQYQGNYVTARNLWSNSVSSALVFRF